MRLVELFILFENKEQYVINTFGPRLVQAYEADPTTAKEEMTAEEITKILAGFDPTPNNKFLVWIAKMYADRQIKSEDLFKLPEELTLFAKIQNKLEVKDIMRYSGLPALAKATMEYDTEEDQQSNKQKAKSRRQEFVDKGEAVIVWDTPKLKVVIPKTEAASCEFGRGTKWCTAATRSHNYFDQYDNLHIVYPKPAGEGAPYQFDIEANKKYHDKSIGMIADVYDDNIRLEDFVKRVPEIRKFLISLAKKGDLNFYRKEDYETIYGKKFADLSKPIKSKWLHNKMFQVLGFSSPRQKVEFIEEFVSTFSEKERMNIFRKNKEKIIKTIGAWAPPKTILSLLEEVFGKTVLNTLTEKDFISKSGLYRKTQSGKSYSGQASVALAIKQYKKYLPNFNENNVYNAAAKSLTEEESTDDYDATQSLDFIHSAMQFKRNYAAVIKAYSGKKTQMKLAEILTNQEMVMAAEQSSIYHRTSEAIEMIGTHILTDPEAVEFAKERLKEMFAKVKAKIKLTRSANNPTQKSIKFVYGFIGNTATLAKTPKYELSIQDRMVKLVGEVSVHAIAMDDDVFFDDRLNLNWSYEENGERIFSQLGLIADKFPTNKMPSEKLRDTFIFAGKKSLIFVYSVRSRDWLMQVPYSDKVTSGGNIGFLQDETKLHDANKINLPDNVRQDVDRILEYIHKQQQNLTGIDIDTDRFTESRQ